MAPREDDGAGTDLGGRSLKRLIVATIEGPSHNDIEEANRSIVKACVETKNRINNGSSIKISSCNPDDMNQLYSLMGRIKFWTLGRGADIQHDYNGGKKARPRKREQSLDDIILGI